MTPKEIERINKISNIQGKAQILLNEWANYMAEYNEKKTPSEKEAEILSDIWSKLNEIVQKIGDELH